MKIRSAELTVGDRFSASIAGTQYTVRKIDNDILTVEGRDRSGDTWQTVWLVNIEPLEVELLEGEVIPL